MVALGGGYDPALLRGRAIWVLDVWTGQDVYRFAASDSTGSTDLRNSLFPVAAPPSLADTDADGLFDTWWSGTPVARCGRWEWAAPGEPNSSNGIYSNWFAARAFVQFKGQPFWHRSPFFQRAVLGLLPGQRLALLRGQR